MGWQGRDIISIRDLSKGDVLDVLSAAKKMESAPPAAASRLAAGKVMASLFFEPSTRTRLSFETAMNHLGGRIIGGAGSEITGTMEKKLESFSDVIRMASGYADVIVVRHPLEGSARLAAEVADVPVINAGDGSNQHPTQTLIDLYTMQKRLGKLENLKIAIVGDLKYGRTVHSLAYALAMFKGVRMTLVSPPELKMPTGLVEEIEKKFKADFKENTSLEAALKSNDVVYMTRIQRERFPDPQEYERLRGAYSISRRLLEETKSRAVIMHPLPRVDEITRDVDATKNAAYFEQAKNGVPVRMALLSLVLGLGVAR